MRQSLIAAVATAALLFTLADTAEAMTLAVPAALGALAANTAVVKHVAVVCGNNGCGPVQTSAPRRRRP